ncbi:putative leader peptide [Actinokineospora alba]|uniref:putative leader peptide n=1 Tax=Actinokineospora alba TaxID=504798 RepID=UPI003898EA43
MGARPGPRAPTAEGSRRRGRVRRQAVRRARHHPPRLPSRDLFRQGEPRDVRPSMRMEVDHTVDAWDSGPMSATEVFLVARRHVDLRRVSSAMCRRYT